MSFVSSDYCRKRMSGDRWEITNAVGKCCY